MLFIHCYLVEYNNVMQFGAYMYFFSELYNLVSLLVSLLKFNVKFINPALYIINNNSVLQGHRHDFLCWGGGFVITVREVREKF